MPEPIADPSWWIEAVGFDPLREREVEAWFTVANGRTGTRGSLEEGSEESSPATYIAGVYRDRTGDLPGPEMLVGPDWARLSPWVGGDAVDLDRGEPLEHRRILDLRQGILFRIWRHRLPTGAEVELRTARFASLADRRFMALEADIRSSGPAVTLADGIPVVVVDDVLQSVDARVADGRLIVGIRGRHGAGASFAISTQAEHGRVRRLVAVVRRVGGLRPDEAVGALADAERRGVPEVR